MTDAVLFISSLAHTIYSGLGSIQFPVLGVSILAVMFCVLLINLTLWTLSILTGGKQDKSSGSGMDDNNNYIYRSRK